MTIRPETPQDRDAIEKVHVAAFATCPYSRQTEHLIVNRLREDGAVVGRIAFRAPAPGRAGMRAGGRSGVLHAVGLHTTRDCIAGA